MAATAAACRIPRQQPGSWELPWIGTTRNLDSLSVEAELFGEVNGAAAGQQGAAEREPGTLGIFANWKKQ